MTPHPLDADAIAAMGEAAGLPSSANYQVLAADVLARLVSKTHPSLDIAGHPIGALDVVSAESIRAGGATAAFADLLDVIHRHDPAAVLDLKRPQHDLRRAIALEPRSIPRFSPANWHNEIEAARTSLYRVRGAVTDAVADRRRPLDWEREPDVVFVAQVLSHIDDLAALARHLRDTRGLRVGFVTDDRRIVDEISRADLAVSALSSPFDRFSRSTYRHLAKIRADTVAGLDRLGRNNRHRAIASGISHAITVELPRAHAVGMALLPLLDLPGRRAVIAPNPLGFAGQVALRLAHARGQGSMGLQHGSIRGDDPRWRHFSADRMCAWGPMGATALVAAGLSPEKVVVTGAARFDDDPYPFTSSQRASPPTGEVLVATSGPGDFVSLVDHLRFVAVLHEAAVAQPRTRWIVRLHRKDSVRWYDTCVADVDNIVVQSADDPDRPSLETQLARVDCLVTVASTTAIDAVRTGTPVITVNLPGRHTPEFAARPTARFAANGPELAAAVEAAHRGLVAPAEPGMLDSYFAHRGKSAASIADQVEELLALR